MAKTNSRGWFVGGGYRIERGGFDNPPRMGVRWSPAEDYDLWLSMKVGTCLDFLAKRHERSPGSIAQRISADEYGVSRCSMGALVFLAATGHKPHFRKIKPPYVSASWVVCTPDMCIVGVRAGAMRTVVRHWKYELARRTREWQS
jgi:hypothetical protein